MPIDPPDNLKKGFVEAPACVTRAAHAYMERIIELRNFVAYLFKIVGAHKKLCDEQDDEELLYRLEALLGDALRAPYNAHRQFVNEILLARAVETFELYILQVLREIFSVQPNLLMSERPIAASTALELGSFEQIVLHLTERKLHDLSFGALSERRAYFSKNIGIELFSSDKAYEMVLLAIEVRNVIAHNDCKVSERFSERTRDIEVPLEIGFEQKLLINDVWLRSTSYVLDSVVFDFDTTSAEKFELETFPAAKVSLQPRHVDPKDFRDVLDEIVEPRVREMLMQAFWPYRDTKSE